ncbi:hypothetical protein Goari_018763, partial [Gossypium aridum]|nr:hypothetical protein [Gossypium aridum]
MVKKNGNEMASSLSIPGTNH